MPEQSMTTETVDPSIISGDDSLASQLKGDIATEAFLDADGVGIRAPSFNEGALMWELAREAGGLDLNSPYAYMMGARNFQSTCAVAEIYGKPVGFVLGHRQPMQKDTLFVWQIGVSSEARGLGIAKRMLENLLERTENSGVRTLEATVTPSNKASRGLFAAFAKSRGARLEVLPCFTVEDFPADQAHEAEELLRISPLSNVA